MTDFVVRHADMWNTWWHGEPSSVLQPLATMREACERTGRDPASIASTVSVSLVYTDLGGRPSTSLYLTGGLADALHGYAELGVAHVIVEFVPFTRPALERFAADVARFRRAQSV
jgi:hypothetical protein